MSNPERCVRCGRLGAAGGSTTLFKEVRKMLKIYRWRLVSLVMALTAIVGLALPALGDDERRARRARLHATGKDHQVRGLLSRSL